MKKNASIARTLSKAVAASMVVGALFTPAANAAPATSSSRTAAAAEEEVSFGFYSTISDMFGCINNPGRPWCPGASKHW